MKREGRRRKGEERSSSSVLNEYCPGRVYVWETPVLKEPDIWTYFGSLGGKRKGY